MTEQDAQRPQIEKEDFVKMQNFKQTMDNLVVQIGNLEFKKAKLVGALNEYNIASERFIGEIIEKYGFPKDRKIVIDENGFVSFDSDVTKENVN